MLAPHQHAAEVAAQGLQSWRTDAERYEQLQNRVRSYVDEQLWHKLLNCHAFGLLEEPRERVRALLLQAYDNFADVTSQDWRKRCRLMQQREQLLQKLGIAKYGIAHCRHVARQYLARDKRIFEPASF